MTSLSEQERQRLGNPTRVDISYQVLPGTPVKRIPFRAGVMGNFSGHNEDLPPLHEREFDSIDQNNFDDVMKRIQPKLDLDVKDTLAADGDPDAKFKVELTFNQFDDFHPTRLVQNIPRLKALYEQREKLMAAKRNLSDPKVAGIATDAVESLKGSGK